MQTNIHFLSYLVQFFLEWETFQTKVVEKIKTRFLLSVFFRQLYLLWDNVEKYSRAGQSTDENMAHARCMLGTEGYKYTLRLCNTHCFSTATVARTRLTVTVYVHCLSCSRCGDTVEELFVWLALVFVRVVSPTVRMLPILILLFDEGNQKSVVILLVNGDVNDMTDATHNRHEVRKHRGVIGIADGPFIVYIVASNWGNFIKL